MITASKVTDVEYYCGGGSEAPNAESYYLDAVTHGEPPGVWSGAGAERLGLAGTVADDDMRLVFGDMVDPRTGEPIGSRPAQRRSVEERLADRIASEPGPVLPERVAELRRAVERRQRAATKGWDMTFGVVKSVTVAHTAAWRAEIAAIRSGDRIGSDRARAIRLAIEGAIVEANAAAIDYLQRTAVSRVGGGSGAPVEWVACPDLTVATFFQHTNRNIDPHLHMHNVVLNRAMCADGKVRALDGTDFRSQRMAAGAIADRVLEERLAALGFSVELRADGVSRELVVAPPEVCDQFSSRRAEIEAALEPVVARLEEARGRELTVHELHWVRQDVTRATRRGKGEAPAETTEERLARLDAECLRLGQSLTGVHAAVVAHLDEAATRPGPQAWSESTVCAIAVSALAQTHSTWTRPDLLRELHLALPTLGVTGAEAVEVLQRLADKVLANPDLAVQVGGIAEHPAEARWVRPTEQVWATAGTLRAEAMIRAAAVTRGGHRVEASAVEAWLDANAATIGLDQRAAVAGIASSDAAMTMLIGPAGTGKSFAAGALAAAWEELSDGGRVVGLAVSEAATNVLRDDGIEHAANTAAWLAAQARLAAGRGEYDQQWLLGARDVVMVDEASMVSTTQLEEIREIAAAAGARVVLTGDPRQLGSVEAGGVMGLLDGKAETYTLAEVRRFTAGWEREASLRLRDGDVEVLAEYDRHGRLLGYDSVADAVRAAAAAAVADRVDGRTTTIITGSNRDATTVARAVRDRLIALGLVDGGAAVMLGRDASMASVGDMIAARRNDYRIGVTNREQYRVLDVGQDSSLRVQAGDGTVLTLPADYVAADTQLAYASTVHAAQGMTTDTCHLVTDGSLDTRSLYVGASRGRDRNTVYVALAPAEGETSPSGITGVPRTVVVSDTSQPSAVAVLEGCMERVETGHAATVVWETDQERRASMSTLGGRIEAVTRVACRERLERHLDQLVLDGALSSQDRARLCADQATEHLARVMRAVEQTGADPMAVLRRAVVDHRGLGDASSVAQCLSHRIRGRRDLALPRHDAAAVPAGIAGEHAAELEQLHARARDRAEVLGARAAAVAPVWATEHLGPVPAAGTPERVDWETRAGIVAAHREATGWDDALEPIGAAPGLSVTERRASYTAAWEALGRPADRLTEAAMTDGRLITWARNGQRLRAEAPMNVDAPLRASEVAAETARQAAAVADAEATAAETAGDHDRAALLRTKAAARRADAEVHQAAVAALTLQAEARDGWHGASLPTLERDRRAREELARRGIAYGLEPDRASTEDWLAAERAARVADDQHRTITEDDVRDVTEDAPLAREEADALPEVYLPVPPVTSEWAGHVANEEMTDVEREAAATLAITSQRRVADQLSQDQHVPAPEIWGRRRSEGAGTGDGTASVDAA